MTTESGLVLEGGGMRGVYTAGALDLFLDERFAFASVYGVSAGACHACSFLSGQRGRAYRAVADYVDSWRYMSFRNLLLTGDFFGEQLVYKDIPNTLLPYDYEALTRQQTAFYAVVTNVRTGEVEYPRVRDLRAEMDLIRASSSLPLLSRMVEWKGEKYLDGGVADPIPFEKSRADGHAKNLVILTQHRGYQKSVDSMLPLMKKRYRRDPAFIRAMEARHERYNESLKAVYAAEKAGAALVLQPKEPVQIGRLERDGDKLQTLYQQGYADAQERVEEIRAFISA